MSPQHQFRRCIRIHIGTRCTPKRSAKQSRKHPKVSMIKKTTLLTNINIRQTILHAHREIARRQLPPVHGRPVVCPIVALDPPGLRIPDARLGGVVIRRGVQLLRQHGRQRRRTRDWRDCAEVVELVLREDAIGVGLVAVT